MTIKGFDGVIFDLDGVITDTASLHSIAWKSTFDKVLNNYKSTTEVKAHPFDIESDYLQYVDGKPRYEGVKSFLESRNLILPFGKPEDKPGNSSYCAIGNSKNEEFNTLLQKNGAVIFETTIDFIKILIENDIKIGLASSSKNCVPILKSSKIDDLFQTIVDGKFSELHCLKGKPDPDIFITACKNLNLSPNRCVVVEDAVSGIEAGKSGNFGLVIGIARHNNHNELKSAGADIVVSDTEELSIDTLETWFETGLNEDNWSIRFTDYIPERQKHRESLLSIGNGYFVTRGAMCESTADEHNYPGTYMAGVYNTLSSEIAGKTIWNEDLVNCPNWLFTSFRINNENWIGLNDIHIIDIERRLDFRTGFLSGWMLIEDQKGRQTMLETLRFASMDNKYIAALEHSVTPINYQADISICTSIDANQINDGVARYRQLKQKHLKNVKTGSKGNLFWLQCNTINSNTDIAVVANVSSENSDTKIRYEEQPNSINAIVSCSISENQDFVIQKTVAMVNCKGCNNPLDTAKKIISEEHDFDILAVRSRRAWQRIWNDIDIQVEGDRKTQKLLRFNLYHLMITASIHSANHDIGIPARGLHGEAYRGHIFWDELFILPFYNLHYTDVSKASLMYRYRRLDAAKKYAADYGFKGAMFPWQSGSNGSEQTQIIHLNPVSGRWDSDYSSLQRHISLAIALNIVRYYEHTGDKQFMYDFGMEMLFEISRFWASSTTITNDKKYHISRVMGPDEFHEKYPDSIEGGITDNAYTNIMCIWLWNKTLKLTSSMGDHLKPVFEKTSISFSEFDQWQLISSKLCIPTDDDNIIEQFSGYQKLEELNWKEYEQKYGKLSRLDRILKAEGKTPDQYKLSKQADLLMAFYNLNNDELTEILEERDFEFSKEMVLKNFDFYFPRTSHGSTLSYVVHAQLAEELGMHDLSWKLFGEALESDFIDIQGGTTSEGIHTGAIAGSVLLVLTAYAGLNLKGNSLNINPNLPPYWNSIKLKLCFRNAKIELIIYKDCINIRADKDIGIRIQNIPLVIEKDDWWNIDL